MFTNLHGFINHDLKILQQSTLFVKAKHETLRAYCLQRTLRGKQQEGWGICVTYNPDS